MSGDHDGKEHDKRNSNPKCHLVHHFNPFLNLGPFLIEVRFYLPFRTIIHEFFLEKEINWIIEYSKPRMTRSREGLDLFYNGATRSQAQIDITLKNKPVTVKKAVTTWLKDIEYIENQHYPLGLLNGEVILAENLVSKDPYRFKVENTILFELSKRSRIKESLILYYQNG